MTFLHLVALDRDGMINESLLFSLNRLWTLKRSASQLGKWKCTNMYLCERFISFFDLQKAMQMKLGTTRWKSGHTLYRWSSQNHRPPNCNIYLYGTKSMLPPQIYRLLFHPTFVNKALNIDKKQHKMKIYCCTQWMYAKLSIHRGNNISTHIHTQTHISSHKCNNTPLPVEKLHFWVLYLVVVMVV